MAMNVVQERGIQSVTREKARERERETHTTNPLIIRELYSQITKG